MRQYLDLLHLIRTSGVQKDDRTGTRTLSIFGHQMCFDLQNGFPLVTTKKVHTNSIVHELLWFLKGDTNIAYFHEHRVSIWARTRRTRVEAGTVAHDLPVWSIQSFERRREEHTGVDTSSGGQFIAAETP